MRYQFSHDLSSLRYPCSRRQTPISAFPAVSRQRSQWHPYRPKHVGGNNRSCCNSTGRRQQRSQCCLFPGSRRRRRSGCSGQRDVSCCCRQHSRRSRGPQAGWLRWPGQSGRHVLHELSAADSVHDAGVPARAVRVALRQGQGRRAGRLHPVPAAAAVRAAAADGGARHHHHGAHALLRLDWPRVLPAARRAGAGARPV